MNEAAAEKLDPVRAAELAHVPDLQARWENMLGCHAPDVTSYRSGRPNWTSGGRSVSHYCIWQEGFGR